MNRERITFWFAVLGWLSVVYFGVYDALKAGPIGHYEYETDLEIDEAELRKYCPEEAENLIIMRRNRHRKNIKHRI